MKKNIFKVLLLSTIFILGGCSANQTDQNISTTDNLEKIEYKKITSEEAKTIMDSGEDHVVVDVRTQGEYESGHIEGALLLPLDEIELIASQKLPDLNQKILLYCRSGNRSAVAARMLIKMGYTDVSDFGGIIDWPYDIVK